MSFNPPRRPLFTALACAGALTLAAPGVWAQVDHSSHGAGSDTQAADAVKSGGKGKKKGPGHGGHAGQPGQVLQMCHDKGGKPPHYCEPHYKVVSSVRGVRITDVSPMGDTAVMVTLQAAGGSSHTINQRLVIVGGSGDLAGATPVAGNWSGETVVHMNLQGNGTLYDQKSMHLHLFPLTGN